MSIEKHSTFDEKKSVYRSQRAFFTRFAFCQQRGSWRWRAERSRGACPEAERRRWARSCGGDFLWGRGRVGERMARQVRVRVGGEPRGLGRNIFSETSWTGIITTAAGSSTTTTTTSVHRGREMSRRSGKGRREWAIELSAHADDFEFLAPCRQTKKSS